MSRAVLILIDGLRPDAIEKANCPNLKALLQRSAYTLNAQSVMPSMTLPCHMSIFHSVPPSRHGVTTNTWMPMARPLPGLVEQAYAAGKTCAAFYNWEPLRNISQPENLYCSYYRNTHAELEGDSRIIETAIQHLTTENIHFAFVYFGTLDTMGHVAGWMSDDYLAHLAQLDVLLGQLLNSLSDDTVILLQSDHGGHDRTHGTDMPEDINIPWLISGSSIRENYQIQREVSLLDTAPTFAHILGVPQHPDWEGSVVDEIFS